MAELTRRRDFHLLCLTPEGKTILANHAGTTTPSRRPATIQDQSFALSEAGHEFVTQLEQAGLDEQQINNAASALGVMIEDRKNLIELEAEGKLSHDEQEFLKNVIAAQCNAVIENMATLDNIAIMQAPERVLEDWVQQYHERLRDLHNLMNTRISKGSGNIKDDPIYTKALCEFGQEAWKLWQTQRRLGIV